MNYSFVKKTNNETFTHPIYKDKNECTIKEPRYKIEEPKYKAGDFIQQYHNYDANYIGAEYKDNGITYQIKSIVPRSDENIYYYVELNNCNHKKIKSVKESYIKYIYKPRNHAPKYNLNDQVYYHKSNNKYKITHIYLDCTYEKYYAYNMYSCLTHQYTYGVSEHALSDKPFEKIINETDNKTETKIDELSTKINTLIEQPDKLEKLKEENKKINTQYDRLRDDFDNLQYNHEDLEDKYYEIKQKCDTLDNSLTEAADEYMIMEKQRDDLQDEYDELKKKYEKIRELSVDEWHVIE